jgi:AraC-like DNA-binding protein
VDALAILLDGPRARGAFLIRSVMKSPWCIRVEDEAPLTLIVMRRGEARLVSDAPNESRVPVTIRAGDLVIIRGPHPCTIADDTSRTPHAVIRPGPQCTTPVGVAPDEAMTTLGLRTWGNAIDGPTEFLVGTYRVQGEISRRLLDALPVLLVLPGGVDVPLAGFLADEALKDQPGQAVVIDRLLDVLIVAVVRTWFSRENARAPKWYTALSDPVVGKALRVIHDRPDQPWTVETLAKDAGVSRAAFARRFVSLTGEPPMAYLTSWRLGLAADLLCEPDITIAEVAQRVGYGSAFALSAAFKRERGISPQQHRDRSSSSQRDQR